MKEKKALVILCLLDDFPERTGNRMAYPLEKAGYDVFIEGNVDEVLFDWNLYQNTGTPIAAVICGDTLSDTLPEAGELLKELKKLEELEEPVPLILAGLEGGEDPEADSAQARAHGAQGFYLIPEREPGKALVGELDRILGIEREPETPQPETPAQTPEKPGLLTSEEASAHPAVRRKFSSAGRGKHVLVYRNAPMVINHAAVVGEALENAGCQVEWMDNSRDAAVHLRSCLDIDLLVIVAYDCRSGHQTACWLMEEYPDHPWGVYLLYAEETWISAGGSFSTYSPYSKVNLFQVFVKKNLLGCNLLVNDWWKPRGMDRLEEVLAEQEARQKEAVGQRRDQVWEERQALPQRHILIYTDGAVQGREWLLEEAAETGCTVEEADGAQAAAARLAQGGIDLVVIHSGTLEACGWAAEPILRTVEPGTGRYTRTVLLYDEPLNLPVYAEAKEFQMFSMEKLCGYTHFTQDGMLANALTRFLKAPQKGPKKRVLIYYPNGDMELSAVARHKKWLEDLCCEVEVLEGRGSTLEQRCLSGPALDLILMCGKDGEELIKLQEKLYFQNIRGRTNYIILYQAIYPVFKTSSKYQNVGWHRVTAMYHVDELYWPMDLDKEVKKALKD